MGHAPTNPNGSPLQPLEARIKALEPYQFGKPGGNRQGANGARATSKQRECMEALQNLEDPEDARALKKLHRRFSPGMVNRLAALQIASMNPELTHFLQAQRLIREILIVPHRREVEADSAPPQRDERPAIELLHGHVDVPLPGGKEEAPTAPGIGALPGPDEGGRKPSS